MRDPGVSLFFGEVNLDRDRSSQRLNNKRLFQDNNNNILGVGLAFCLKFLFVIFSVFFLLSFL